MIIITTTIITIIAIIITIVIVTIHYWVPAIDSYTSHIHVYTRLDCTDATLLNTSFRNLDSELLWVSIKGGCSRRGVQWMGVVYIIN